MLARPAPRAGGSLARGSFAPIVRAWLPVEGVDELAEDGQLRLVDRPCVPIGAGRMVRLDTGSIEHALGRKDAGARANRQRERVGRSRVDFDLPVAHVEHEPGVERLVGEVRDDHLAHGRPEDVEDRREQVVGERPLRHLALELHGDRAGLPLPDPDGQVAIPLELTQDHHVLGREHVDADALDGHLDQPADHGPIIPLAGRPRFLRGAG